MLTNQKQYVLNLANLGSVKSELVGDLAIFNRLELEKGINLPIGFVVTTTAFDDFLVANDLVDFIGPRINDTDYSDHEQLKKNSREIREAIKQATMPDLLSTPILKAYSGLSGFSEACIKLQVSAINPELEVSIKGQGDFRTNIIGKEMLLDQIKELWSELFSTEAMLYRSKIGYEGFMTEAVIVQKQIQAEVSGRVYTVNPTDNDPTVMEIQAIWGMDDGNVLHEIMPDSYFIDKRSGDVVEKKIIGQDWMLVRKGKPDVKDPYLKIKISQVWQKRAKLDDRYLYTLFTYAAKIKEIRPEPQEIFWCLEAGKIYVLGSYFMDMGVAIEEKYPLGGPRYSEELLELSKKAEAELDARVQAEETQESKSKKSVADYVDEVTDNTRQIKEAEPEVQTQAEPVPEPAVTEEHPLVEDLPGGLDLKDITGKGIAPEQLPEPEVKLPESEPSQPEPPVEQPKVEEPVAAPDISTLEPAEDKVIVDVKPVKELSSILKGNGCGQKLRFGLAHFVFENYDLEDLTGDEILILKAVSPSLLPFINKVRGAIIEGVVPDNYFQSLKVPVIYGLKNAFEVLRDKEVITLDPESGKIYLGAGVKDAQQMQASNAGIRSSSGETIMAAPGNIDSPGVSVVEQESSLPVGIYENPRDVPVTTTSEFWQLLDLTKVEIEKKNSHGVYICMDELYTALDKDPLRVLEIPSVRKDFLNNAAAFIRGVALKSGGRSIIIQSLTKTFRKEHSALEHTHELIQVDLELISRLRNKDGIRNISYSLADVLTEDELVELKKDISSEGIRRSATFKVLAVIDMAFAGIAVKSFVQNGNIDGIVIDLDRLLVSFGLENSKDLDDNLANFLRYVIEIVNSNNCQTMLINRGININNAQLKLFLEKGLNNFVTPVSQLMNFKLQVSDQELSQLVKNKKRGRKRKNIDFGF